MATAKSEDTKDTTEGGGKYDAKKNPSGASDAQIKKGERVGKPLSPEVDESFHTYEFTDPMTGEPVETKPTVHDDSGYVK
jgi:hypothetical protein